jgi:hypothetical protein
MPRGAVREREQKSPNFPVKFPVSREIDTESGSLETPSTAIESIKPTTYRELLSTQAFPGKLTGIWLGKGPERILPHTHLNGEPANSPKPISEAPFRSFQTMRSRQAIARIKFKRPPALIERNLAWDYEQRGTEASCTAGWRSCDRRTLIGGIYL